MASEMGSLEFRPIPEGRAREICIRTEYSIGEKYIVAKSYARKIGIITEGCAVKRCYVFEGRKREYCSIAEICTTEVRFISELCAEKECTALDGMPLNQI